MYFSEVIGQEEAHGRLLQLVKEDRIPHAMMLCGPMGSGKMALAMAFASLLLGDIGEAERQDAGLASFLKDFDAPKVRNAHAMLAKWEHPDLHFTYPVIRPKGTSADHKMTSDDFAREWRHLLQEGPYFTMDQWMGEMNADNQQAWIFEGESDDLTRKLSLKASQGGYKVALVWLPERMNAACANKLLKLIEEPPMKTVFVMVCEEPEKLLETIRSRVQRIDVRKIDDASVERALVERRGLTPDMAARIAHIANGNWLNALAELDTGSENRAFLDMFEMLMRLAYMRNVKSLRKWAETVATYGRERQRRMLGYFLRLVRENFAYNFHEEGLVYMTKDEEDFARNFARFIHEGNVIGMAETFQKAQRDIGQNANAKMVFFDMALQVIMLLLRKA